MKSDFRRPFIWFIFFSGVSPVMVMAATCGDKAPAYATHELKAVRWDPVLKQKWVTVTDCVHPERPAITRQTSDPILDKSYPGLSHETRREEPVERLPVVHAGDAVRLWRQEANIRMELAAVSEESGGLGEKVRVRLIRTAHAEAQTEQQFVGIVRSPGDVEIRQ